MIGGGLLAAADECNQIGQRHAAIEDGELAHPRRRWPANHNGCRRAEHTLCVCPAKWFCAECLSRDAVRLACPVLKGTSTQQGVMVTRPPLPEVTDPISVVLQKKFSLSCWLVFILEATSVAITGMIDTTGSYLHLLTFSTIAPFFPHHPPIFSMYLEYCCIRRPFCEMTPT